MVHSLPLALALTEASTVSRNTSEIHGSFATGGDTVFTQCVCVVFVAHSFPLALMLSFSPRVCVVFLAHSLPLALILMLSPGVPVVFIVHSLPLALMLMLSPGVHVVFMVHGSFLATGCDAVAVSKGPCNGHGSVSRSTCDICGSFLATSSDTVMVSKGPCEAHGLFLAISSDAKVISTIVNMSGGSWVVPCVGSESVGSICVSALCKSEVPGLFLVFAQG